MHPLCQGFRETVTQGFQHDRAVIVVLVAEGFQVRLNPKPGTHRKHAHPVRFVGFHRCNEIAQTEIRLLPIALHLHPQIVQHAQGLRAALIGIQHHVITLRIRREEPNHRFGLHPLFRHHLLQHRLRIRIQLGAFLTHNLIRQNGREFTRQFPTTEKRCPINPLHQLDQRIIVEHKRGRGVGFRRRIIRPIHLKLIRPRRRNTHQLTLSLICRPLHPHLLIFRPNTDHIIRLLLLRQQRTRHAHRPRRILHIHHDVILKLRLDLHRRMNFGGGRPANQQRHMEILPLHFLGNVYHFIQRRCD